MDDKNFASGTFAHGSWSVDWKGGKVVGSIVYSGGIAVGSVSVEVGSKEALEALKVLIPGKIDDAIISVIESALGL